MDLSKVLVENCQNVRSRSLAPPFTRLWSFKFVIFLFSIAKNEARFFVVVLPLNNCSLTGPFAHVLLFVLCPELVNKLREKWLQSVGLLSSVPQKCGLTSPLFPLHQNLGPSSPGCLIISLITSGFFFFAFH